MRQDQEPENLEQLLERLRQAEPRRGRVSVGAIVEAVGRRSFGPLLLVAGLLTFSPLSGIPGMPTAMGALVFLTAGQLLIGRRHFWLPRWLLKRSVARATFHKALGWLQPPARSIDRFVRPRLTFFTRRAGTNLIAALCVLIACTMPPMELIPFTVSGVGFALTILGLSLIAHDGLLALIALLFMGTVLGTTLYLLEQAPV